MWVSENVLAVFEQQQRQGRDCMPELTLAMRRKYNKNNWQFSLDNTTQEQQKKNTLKASFFPRFTFFPGEQNSWPVTNVYQKGCLPLYHLCPENWRVLVPFHSFAGPALSGHSKCFDTQVMCAGKRDGVGFTAFYCLFCLLFRQMVITAAASCSPQLSVWGNHHPEH